jgi:hypothetical protein
MFSGICIVMLPLPSIGREVVVLDVDNKLPLAYSDRHTRSNAVGTLLKKWYN